MSEPASIEANQLLPHPPSRVWKALTDPTLLARWLMPNDFQPIVGHKFSLDTGGWGKTSCEVLELVPEKLLKISWKNPPLDTTVTWRLEPEGTGTRLSLIHAGFNLDDPNQRMAYDGMSGGWRTGIPARLVTLLSEAP